MPYIYDISRGSRIKSQSGGVMLPTPAVYITFKNESKQGKE